MVNTINGDGNSWCQWIDYLDRTVAFIKKNDVVAECSLHFVHSMDTEGE